MAKETIYSPVKEAQETIEKLCAKYSDVLWQVRPASVIVMGVENKERGKKNNTLAKVRTIRGSERAVLQLNNVPVRYIIELYWSDWNDWKERFKQWIILHELLHICNEEGKLVRHDSEDFKIILDAVGVNWAQPNSQLPNLLEEDVEFDLDLRPGLTEENKENDSDEIIPEEVNVEETEAEEGVEVVEVTKIEDEEDVFDEAEEIDEDEDM